MADVVTLAGMGAYGAGAVGTVIDPLGGVSAMIAGWVMDHVKPLKAILDELAGNPDTVKGIAATWKNISKELDHTATQYAADIKADTAYWHGDAGDAYRSQALHRAEVIKLVGEAADGMGWWITAASEMVTAVRNFVRDLLANTIGELVVMAAAVVATEGAALPLCATAAEGLVLRQTQIAIDLSRALTTALRNNMFWWAKVAQHVQALAKVLPAMRHKREHNPRNIPGHR
ncbi:hypothetical protein D5S17_11685 [Pseudonocardiaceae bacterium YIM PH 21723]|nr:hypothetical protein D5S17_11685 [Pseudonocardiaceae bacterium YIM PH 21723]